MPDVRERLVELQRKFNPGQLRDDDGRWTDMPGEGAVSALKDVLRLAGKIDLEPGERLLGSDRIDGDNGGIRLALTERHGERTLRLGLGVEEYGKPSREDGIPAWDGNSTRPDLPEADRRRLDAEFDALDDEYDTASPARRKEIDARQGDIRMELSAGDEDFNGTAKIDEYAMRRLADRIRPALAEAVQQEKTQNAAWDEIEALQASGNPDPARMAELRRIAQADRTDAIVFTEGIVPGSAWGDVHYEVGLDDLSFGAYVTLGVKPKDSPDDWGDGRDWLGQFDAAETRKLLRLLDRYTGDASRSEVALMSDVSRMQSADGGGTRTGRESDNPGAKPGGPKGGQFALGGGRVGAKGKSKPAGRRPAARPGAKKPGPPKPLSYDGKTGTGYGIKGGDARVRSLQAAINKFGLTDFSGRPLAVDGKYGPRTTSAVKKLQRAMGVEATGIVDEAFLKRVSSAKTLNELRPAKAPKPSAKPAPRRRPVRQRQGYREMPARSALPDWMHPGDADGFGDGFEDVPTSPPTDRHVLDNGICVTCAVRESLDEQHVFDNGVCTTCSPADH